jgi:polysaccharide biosynthesis/export protein
LAGYANHTAAVGKSKLVRQTAAGVEEIDLEVSAIQKGKRPDVTLMPDDVVYVPFSFMRNVGINGQGILASVASATIYAH